MNGVRPPRCTLARVAVVALLVPSVASALTYDSEDRSALKAGTVTSAANGTTVVST